MKLLRILEAIGVPLALAYVGGYAAPFVAYQLISALGRTYSTNSVMAGFWLPAVTGLCGLVAGIAAVIVQRKKNCTAAVGFYALIPATLPISTALLVAIEAVRWLPAERLAASLNLGVRLSYDIGTVPFWILGVGFGGPFLLLLRRKKPAELARPQPDRVSPLSR